MLFINSSIWTLPPANASSNSFHKNYDNPGTIKGTVRAATGGANSQSTLVPNARLALTNTKIASFVLRTTSDESGSFIFENVPAGQYQLSVEADTLPTATRDINLTPGENLVVEIDLAVEVSESVTVRPEEGLLSTSETTTSNIVRAETLKSQPFRDDEYQSALPLTPGVVQDANGDDYIKGSRAGQSNYTVNGADVTDPITGEPIFEIPLEAVANIQIEENPYSAEFGHFTGGVTNLQSKGGGDKFDVSVARLFPTLHNVVSTKVDSFRPRVTFSGPIIKDRLYFLQSFEYRFRREYVPDLPEPFDNTATERFSSFSQLDLRINKTNQLKFNFALYPEKIRFYGLDIFNPAPVTPNVKQRGYLVSLSEQMVFKNTSFLTSAVSYYTSDFEVFGQGTEPMTLVSDVNRGNYFADTRTASKRLQWQETYYFAPFEFRGKHSLKTGFEYNNTDTSSIYRFNTIFLRRLDNTLAQRVDFTAPERSDFGYNEFGFFVQNRWVANTNLTFDAGIRYDYDGVSKENNLAPRFSFLYTPFQSKRTVIRGGVGIFYDRTLPVAGYFDNNAAVFTPGATGVPERIVTNYAADGTTVIGGPRFFDNITVGDLDSPRSVRWSVHFDQGITEDLTFRVGYLERRTRNELIVEPIAFDLNTGANILSSTGRSRYRELQFLAAYNHRRLGRWNVSYTLSKAVGDLNTADRIIGNFPSFVIQPNEFSLQPFDAPHRFLAYGQIELPWQIRVAPLFEYRTGFPFSAVNDRREFVGERNRAGRFPDYLSFDVQITKGFRVPFFEKYLVRAGAALFNVTDHFNPRDVQNNINNPNYGTFYNDLGFGVKAKFDVEF